MDSKARANFINSMGNNARTEDGKQASNENRMTAASTVSNGVINKVDESAFAQGLPSWDVVPPQIAVRRIRRK